MARLNSSVVIPETKEVASSDRPLAEAWTSTPPRNTGRRKWRRLSRFRKTRRPARAVREYPSPVAMAAPRMPRPARAIRT